MIIDNRLGVFINKWGIKNLLILFIPFFISFNIYDAKGQVSLKRDSLSKVESSKVTVEPTVIPTVTRGTQKDDYLTTPKPHTSGVFGSSFFDSPSLSFEPNLRIATPTNYILGPDDELAINVSGYQEINLKTTIGPEGTILIPQVGTIELSGLRIDDAIARIKNRMAQTAYPSLKNNLSRLTVSLGKIRSIHITAIGAYKPGNFTVSSLTTVYNALLACGGPGDINTYRNIELLRNNKIFTTIDLYQFLTRGDQKGNVVLKDGDVISFPVYKKHVSISGQVKRGGVFELKDNENLEDLLFFAGGYTDKAYKAQITVKQITDFERKIRTIYRADIPNFKPLDGDEFTVDTVLDRIENGVAIAGPLYRAGDYELTPGLTVGVLVQRAGGLMEGAFTDRATLTRKHPDGTLDNITFNLKDILNGRAADIPLVKYDVVNIATSAEFKTLYTIQIEGEVKKPGSYPYKANLSLKDIFFAAGGFTDAASSYRVEVSRRLTTERLNKDVDSIATVLVFNTDKDLTIENNRFILQPNDVINVRRNPAYIEQQKVSVQGEVYYPGIYVLESKSEHVSSILKRTGGLTALAYKKGIYLLRHTAQDNEEEQAIIQNIQKNIKDSTSKVIEDASKTNFRIPINLDKVLNQPGSIEDYQLLDGDQILVSRIDPLVKVSGQVLSATKTGFIKGKHLNYYLTQAGGTAERARKSKIYVLYADGHIKRVNNGFLGLFRSYPPIETGAQIIVPKKIDTVGMSPTEIIGLTTGIVSTLTLIVLTITSLRK
jgi:protein involved in polysaccharide export with SLBB domain